MSHSAPRYASHCERIPNRKRKDSGAAGSEPSQCRVKTKNSTNRDAVRVLCPFFIKSPHELCKAHSCRMTGFSEVAKMRDHLKDVHNLSRDLLDKLNFKSGRFRSLKTLEEKWKLAFIILFPHVPIDEVPSPFREEPFIPFGIDNNNSGKGLPASFNTTEFITKDGRISHDLLDVFAARIQNWVFDRLTVEAEVPIDNKLDIIADFPSALERIMADLAGPGTADACKPTADVETNRSLPDLDLESSLSATCLLTPIFEFADDQHLAEATSSIEPVLSVGKIDGETNIDCYTSYGNAQASGETTVDCYASHGLPNLSIPAAFPMVDSTYEDAKWAAEQLSMDSTWPSINDGSFLYQYERFSSSNPTFDYAAIDNKDPDFVYQLPTPPATPGGRDTLLDAKELVSPIVCPKTSSTTIIDAPAQEDFIISNFFTCLEDSENYYLGDGWVGSLL